MKAVRKTLLLVGMVFSVVSCIRHQDENSNIEAVTQNDTVEIKYAQGFEVLYFPGLIKINTHSINNNSPFSDGVALLTDPAFKKDSVLYNAEINSIVCQSSTHLAFLDTLGVLEKVKGLCGLEYVQNLRIADKLRKYQVQEVCASEKMNQEKILEIDPDIFFIYPFENTESEKNSIKGITELYIAEYLEETPLARLEWIKLFGVLMDKASEANAIFEGIEAEYNSLIRQQTGASKKFILNLPYKDNWHMPSSNSLIVNLIEDAGLDYFYESDGITENDLHSKESVWDAGMTADYWIIMANRPADYTLNDLIKEEAVYAKFKAVMDGTVIFCNTATTDYFSSGILEPQVMLKDLLFATKQISNHNPVYFKILK